MRSKKSSRISRVPNNKNLKLFLAVVVCTLMLIVFVSGQVYIISLEQNIISISDEIAEINNEIDHLRIETAELSKGSRIKTIAHVNLNMKMPEGTPQRLF
jgi:cell division protein FtsL